MADKPVDNLPVSQPASQQQANNPSLSLVLPVETRFRRGSTIISTQLISPHLNDNAGFRFANLPGLIDSKWYAIRVLSTDPLVLCKVLIQTVDKKHPTQ